MFVIIVEHKFFTFQIIDGIIINLVNIEVRFFLEGIQNIIIFGIHKINISSNICYLSLFVVHALVLAMLIKVYIIKKYIKLLSFYFF